MFDGEGSLTRCTGADQRAEPTARTVWLDLDLESRAADLLLSSSYLHGRPQPCVLDTSAGRAAVRAASFAASPPRARTHALENGCIVRIAVLLRVQAAEVPYE